MSWSTTTIISKSENAKLQLSNCDWNWTEKGFTLCVAVIKNTHIFEQFLCITGNVRKFYSQDKVRSEKISLFVSLLYTQNKPNMAFCVMLETVISHLVGVWFHTVSSTPLHAIFVVSTEDFWGDKVCCPEFSHLEEHLSILVFHWTDPSLQHNQRETFQG